MTAIERADEPPNWRADGHLDVDGHRTVAAGLAPRVSAVCAGVSPHAGLPNESRSLAKPERTPRPRNSRKVEQE
jgi:hypothetical protein